MDEDILLFAGTAKRQKSVLMQQNVVLQSQGEDFDAPVSITEAEASFELFGVDDWLVAALRCLAISKPTAVQRACMPKIFAQNDIIAASKTGSGKTATFAVPILHELGREPRGFFAVVLTPTRYHIL